jgi:sialic acid synthase SpsE
MRETVDAAHEELTRILEELLASDVNITAREVARRHSALKNQSAFTRHKQRADLIEKAQQRQVDARNVRSTPVAEKAATLAQQIELKSARITELEQQVINLVASHAACVRAVMQHGGMRSLQAFWRDYSVIGDSLANLGALPEGAQVIPVNWDTSNKGKVDVWL